jgi:hypothetical protein
MPTHWTYAPCEPAAELEQGDILRPTERLRAIFSEVHPHFRDDKYLGFLVSTQSCDLVRRRESPKASYINLAAIRPLSQVLHKVLSHVAVPVHQRAFRASDKAEARRLLERVLNQNEQSVGLFFLHPDTDAGIGEPAVAFLRVAVALRAEHYDALREARVGRVTPEFRAKLGWLIGNLYVRPATRDWSDIEGGKKKFEELIRQYLDDAQWIDDEILEQAAAQGVEVANAAPAALEALRPPSRLDRALAEIQTELVRVAPGVGADDVRKLQNRLRNSGKFIKLFKF